MLEYFKTFLSCMRMIVGVWNSIYKAPYGNSVSFLPITNPKFHEIFEISGTLSALEWDTVIQWETPIGAWLSHNLPHIYKYINMTFWQHLWAPSWSTLCCFCRKLISNFMQNIRFRTPSQHWKRHIVLQGETTIGAWVFQTFPFMYENDCRSLEQHLQSPLW